MQQVNRLRCRSIPIERFSLIFSSCAFLFLPGGVDVFFGGLHSPIQGPSSGPYGGTRPQDLTNLLYEVCASSKRPACDLSTPKSCSQLLEAYRLRPKHSCHLLSLCAHWPR